MKQYKHIFFDLDKTIWDFETSSAQTFREIFVFEQLPQRGIASFEPFYEVYKHYNNLLWEQYRNGQIQKETLHVRRFLLALNDYGINDLALATRLADTYLARLPFKNNVFPGTHETLGYLSQKYVLHIITNGFEEVQYKKMETSDLRKYFTCIITSEDAGIKKPDPGIFFYAFRQTGAVAEQSLMVGDDLDVDVLGAKNAGIDQVFFNYNHVNHSNNTTYEIFTLSDLLKFL
ncbi:MAG: YjjG family noncanonical pyrimidine nucleotidase [Lentimicrobiaceae bacterium]|nr:YjjG family noncanonical pyrimidine nucleotidase [Lentimicrobiaceae bacterium]